MLAVFFRIGFFEHDYISPKRWCNQCKWLVQDSPTSSPARTSLLQHALGGKGFMVMLACLAPLDKYYEDDEHSLLMKNAAQVAWVYHSKLLHLFHMCICLKFMPGYILFYLVSASYQTSRERGPTLACAFALDVKSFPEDNLSTLQYAAQVCLGIAWLVVLSKNFSHTCEMTTLEYDQTEEAKRRDVFFQQNRTRPSTMTEPEYIVELVSTIFYYHWNMWFLKCVSNRAPQKTPMDLVGEAAMIKNEPVINVDPKDGRDVWPSSCKVSKEVDLWGACSFHILL